MKKVKVKVKFQGYPGWHIECSAMSSKYLGQQFDIHTGGIDHIPIHHTNEIAQSEAAFGRKPWVKYWLHNEFLVLEKEKMAKSGENFITLSKLEEKGFEPLDFRYFCLGTHYRKPLMFSYEGLKGARFSRKKLVEKVLEIKGSGGKVSAEHLKEFTSSINDDLNTPKALAVVWDVLKSELFDKDKYATLLEFDEVLGLGLKEIKAKAEKIPQTVREIAKEREKARKEKDWAKADELRGKINKLGYKIDDLPKGFEIKKIA